MVRGAQEEGLGLQEEVGRLQQVMREREEEAKEREARVTEKEREMAELLKAIDTLRSKVSHMLPLLSPSPFTPSLSSNSSQTCALHRAPVTPPPTLHLFPAPQHTVHILHTWLLVRTRQYTELY